MRIRQIHHVAYRCNDTKETVEFYERVLGMRFLLAISEDRVPSTKEPAPYMHVFLDAGNGNILAFFELPNAPPMGRDPNTPAWVQHIRRTIASLSRSTSLIPTVTALNSLCAPPATQRLLS